jgi:hypothetical protein
MALAELARPSCFRRTRDGPAGRFSDAECGPSRDKLSEGAGREENEGS